MPLDPVAGRYLDLLKRCLTDTIRPEQYRALDPSTAGARQALLRPLASLVTRLLRPLDLALVRRVPFDAEKRARGHDWPVRAETMIGLDRLTHLQGLVGDLLERGVTGDFLEAGVWRGGTAIFLRALLEAHGDKTRSVWVADSFEGLPRPREEHPQDQGDRHWTHGELAAGLSEVRGNFERYGLLDDRVRFLPGWFSDSLPAAPVGGLALLRVDADMYGSTMDVLQALHHKVEPGGYVVVDDYGAVPACKAAVEDFRRDAKVASPIVAIDHAAVYWQK